MTSPPAQPSNNGPQGLGLGWFLGVYTPTVLTILGVILYMRMGWVVGNSGVLGAMGIVLLANGITFITALSISLLLRTVFYLLSVLVFDLMDEHSLSLSCVELCNLPRLVQQ